MADGVAIHWIVGLAVYFMVLFALVYGVNGAFGTSISNGNEPSSLLYNSTPQCGGDRQGSELFGQRASGSLRCEDLIADTQQACELFSGCTWTNTSTYLWIFEREVPAYCEGSINATSLGINENELLLGYYTGYNICNISGLDTAPKCEIFACEWGSSNFELNPFSSFSFGGAWSTIQWMAGFSVEYGLEFEGKAILSVFLFYIPALAFLLAIRFLLPV